MDESERGAAPCQAKVHIRAGEALSVFNLLCERGITKWVPSTTAFSDSHGTYLNGLFGVIKPGRFTAASEPVLRVIMNFIPVNGILSVIKGDINFLPSPTAWLPICAEEGDVFYMSQGDMQSAFYLFEMPAVWEPFMCFNFDVNGAQVGGDPNVNYRPVCKVLPMGWSSSVGIMQQVSRQVLLMKGLSPCMELQKVDGMPRWFTNSVESADNDRAWWQVYLDNFMAGESTTGNRGIVNEILHLDAMTAWDEAGILTAKDKQVLSQESVIELGVRFEGSLKLLGASPERILKTIWASFHLFWAKRWSRREAQVVLGRWIFILQYRRAAMGCLARAWEATETFQPKPAQVEILKKEITMLICLAPLLQTDLTMRYDDVVTCSDASESGGAVARSTGLTWSGRSFVHRGLRQNMEAIPAPILVISCFNGVGGCFRIYDILGVKPLGLVSIEICREANRVTRSTWPHVEELHDINNIGREEVLRWANDFARAREVHFWGGFPCVHLSSVRAYRRNLEGEGSNLFGKLLELLGLVQEIFSTFAVVKFCVENVASMDEGAHRQISTELEVMPVKLDPADCLPYSRPRLAWCSEVLFEMDGIQLWTEGDYVRAYVTGPTLETKDWIRPGWTWRGEETGCKFPTFMKAIKRDRPPPVPAGLRRATESMVTRWTEDCFRFPPYQYADKFLLSHVAQPDRLLDSSERELLMGFGPGHTATCMSASTQKKSKVKYEDIRKSLIGDSFSILSFGIIGAVLCQDIVPRLSPRRIIRRLGLAPGASVHPDVEVPLSRWLHYGGDGDAPTSDARIVQQLGLSVNHTGSDIHVATGNFLGKHPQAHCSVRALWWQWKNLFKTRWVHPSHINFLEMKMIVQALLWKVRYPSSLRKRWLHLEDSMVCLFILAKGRTSSKLLQPLCSQIGAIQLAAGSVLLNAHVSSTENPTDAASRN